MSMNEWPEWMARLTPRDAERGTYGPQGRRNNCGTPRCAAGWVAGHFAVEIHEAIYPYPGTPLARFVATLQREMKCNGASIEGRFEGWGTDRISAEDFAKAWNRSIRKHGYRVTFDRPQWFEMSRP